MVINFLQTRSPPILPSLHVVYREKREKSRTHQDNGGGGGGGGASPAVGLQPHIIQDVDCSFYDNDRDPWLYSFGKANTQLIHHLVPAFFHYYAHVFDYDKDVVSVRSGCRLTKQEKGWDVEVERMCHFLCVEEPFNIKRNLGNSADFISVAGIRNELARAYRVWVDTGGDFKRVCRVYQPSPVEVLPVASPTVVWTTATPTAVLSSSSSTYAASICSSNSAHHEPKDFFVATEDGGSDELGLGPGNCSPVSTMSSLFSPLSFAEAVTSSKVSSSSCSPSTNTGPRIFSSRSDTPPPLGDVGSLKAAASNVAVYLPENTVVVTLPSRECTPARIACPVPAVSTNNPLLEPQPHWPVTSLPVSYSSVVAGRLVPSSNPSTSGSSTSTPRRTTPDLSSSSSSFYPAASMSALSSTTTRHVFDSEIERNSTLVRQNQSASQEQSDSLASPTRSPVYNQYNPSRSSPRFQRLPENLFSVGISSPKSRARSWVAASQHSIGVPGSSARLVSASGNEPSLSRKSPSILSPSSSTTSPDRYIPNNSRQSRPNISSFPSSTESLMYPPSSVRPPLPPPRVNVSFNNNDISNSYIPMNGSHRARSTHPSSKSSGSFSSSSSESAYDRKQLLRTPVANSAEEEKKNLSPPLRLPVKISYADLLKRPPSLQPTLPHRQSPHLSSSRPLKSHPLDQIGSVAPSSSLVAVLSIDTSSASLGSSICSSQSPESPPFVSSNHIATSNGNIQYSSPTESCSASDIDSAVPASRQISSMLAESSWKGDESDFEIESWKNRSAYNVCSSANGDTSDCSSSQLAVSVTPSPSKAALLLDSVVDALFADEEFEVGNQSLLKNNNCSCIVVAATAAAAAAAATKLTSVEEAISFKVLKSVSDVSFSSSCPTPDPTDTSSKPTESAKYASTSSGCCGNSFGVSQENVETGSNSKIPTNSSALIMSGSGWTRHQQEFVCGSLSTDPPAASLFIKSSSSSSSSSDSIEDDSYRPSTPNISSSSTIPALPRSRSISNTSSAATLASSNGSSSSCLKNGSVRTQSKTKRVKGQILWANSSLAGFNNQRNHTSLRSPPHLPMSELKRNSSSPTISTSASTTLSFDDMTCRSRVGSDLPSSISSPRSNGGGVILFGCVPIEKDQEVIQKSGSGRMSPSFVKPNISYRDALFFT